MGAETLHICYCLTPTRYVWDLEAYLDREQFGRGVRAAARLVAKLYRRWDYAAAQRVGQFIAISTEVQARIQRIYGRESTIVYPPVEVTARFAPSDVTDDYFLVVSRLVPYKRIDLAVQACTRLGLPLIVGGQGRDRARLEAMAGPTVQFIGYVPDEDLPDLFARCRAFIFPGLEDFGITPVQAQAAGRPVIAFRGGGAGWSFGKTGLLFAEPTSNRWLASCRRSTTRIRSCCARPCHAVRFGSLRARHHRLRCARGTPSAGNEAAARRHGSFSVGEPPFPHFSALRYNLDSMTPSTQDQRH